jgi:hypothetical protein
MLGAPWAVPKFWFTVSSATLLAATMNTSQPRRFAFPLWQYLNQPLFNPSVKLVLNPRRFWQIYTLQLLSRCWQQECAQKGNSAP